MAASKANEKKGGLKKTSFSSVKSNVSKKSKRAVSSKDNSFDYKIEESVSSEASPQTKKVSSKTKIAFILAFIVIGVILYLSRGLFIAASVNGELISRLSVVSELEKRFGKQALDSMITEKIVTQEAKKKGVLATEEQINSEISKIEESVKAQGQNLDTLLSFQGMNRNDLRKQVALSRNVQNIFGDEVKPSDEEIAKYVKDNASLFGKDDSEEKKKEQAKEQLTQERVGSKFQTWIEEQKKASKIEYFVSY